MRNSFCFLDMDERTYNYIKYYYLAIKNGSSLFAVDLEIQRKEIEQYLRENNYNMNDQEAISDWITKNSANFRSYLNSIKIIAMYLYFLNKMNLMNHEIIQPEIIKNAINLWNEEKIPLVDSIFI